MARINLLTAVDASSTYVSVGETNVDASAYGDDITAAIAALPAGGGTVWLPKAAYTVASTITKTKANVSLRGSRKAETEIRLTTGGQPLFANGTDNGHAYDANDYDGPQGFGLSDLTLKYTGTKTALTNGQGTGYGAGTYGIRDWRGGDIRLRSVRIEAFEYGFWGIQSDVNAWEDVDLRYCKVGAYLGPRSDQATLERLYAAYCDTDLWLDGVFQVRVRNSQFVGGGASGINPIKVGSQWSRASQGVLFDACWFEHVQGAASIEAFVELGVGDTYQTTDVVIRDPFVITNAQGGGSPYAQYLVKIGNADHLHIQARARSQAMGSLAAIIRDVGDANKNMTIESDLTHAAIAYSNAGASIVTPVFIALNGGTADGMHVLRGSTGQRSFATKRTTDTNDRWILDVNGKQTWGDGSTGSGNADTTLYRNAADQLKTDDALVVADALIVKTKAGAPLDSDFLHTPSDGAIAVNTSGRRLAFRAGGAFLGAEAFDRHPLRPSTAFAETLPRMASTMGSQAILSSGRASFTAVQFAAGEVVTSLAFASGSTAAAGVSNIWYVLVTSAGVQAGITADDSAAGWAANTVKTLALASPYTVPTTGVYYVAVMVNATTIPTIVGINQSGTIAGALTPVLGYNDTAHTGLTNPASAPATWTLGSTSGLLAYCSIA